MARHMVEEKFPAILQFPEDAIEKGAQQVVESVRGSLDRLLAGLDERTEKREDYFEKRLDALEKQLERLRQAVTGERVMLGPNRSGALPGIVPPKLGRPRKDFPWKHHTERPDAPVDMTKPPRRGRPPRTATPTKSAGPVEVWDSSSNMARRPPKFVVEMTGLSTKKELIEAYGPITWRKGMARPRRTTEAPAPSHAEASPPAPPGRGRTAEEQQQVEHTAWREVEVKLDPSETAQAESK